MRPLHYLRVLLPETYLTLKENPLSLVPNNVICQDHPAPIPSPFSPSFLRIRIVCVLLQYKIEMCVYVCARAHVYVHTCLCGYARAR